MLKHNCCSLIILSVSTVKRISYKGKDLLVLEVSSMG